MLDIKFIRENPELVEKSAKLKGYDVDIKLLLDIYQERRKLSQEKQELEAKRNLGMKGAIAEAIDEEERQKGKKLRQGIAYLEDKLKPLNESYNSLIQSVPNIIPLEDTPEGGEEANKEVKTWGKAEAKDVKDHVTWAEERGLLDFERGAKVAGNKFYYTKGALVELELALLQFGMELAKKHGFTPMLVPHMVNTKIIEGAGFSAKGDERQIYKVEDEDLNLIATAEIPLTGYHADEILDLSEPNLYAGFSPSYRVEAGAYGKHAKGLYRVHQFDKLELYVFCEGNLKVSEDWHQKMVAMEEELCQTLELPYRVVRIAAGDLGAPAYKKFDIEYWSPVDVCYRELMSCSNVTDYQARRLNIRYKDKDGKTQFAHTLNGTLAAMSRLLIAIIENFQDKDGKVDIPKALQPYMHGQTSI